MINMRTCFVLQPLTPSSGDRAKFLHHGPAFEYQADAVSANTRLTRKSWKEFHRYRVEWQLPASDPAGKGYVQWYLDDEVLNPRLKYDHRGGEWYLHFSVWTQLIFGVDGSSIGSPNGAEVRKEILDHRPNFACP